MINKIKNKKQNQGQIAIIVLLASAIILTLGLSASKKAIIDTKVDTDEQLLKEAFNAAESGINNYLNDGNLIYETGGGGRANVSSVAIGGDNVLESEGLILKNKSQFFWLVNHNDDGSIGTNYYGSSSISLTVDDDFDGSIKINYFYKSGSEYKVSHIGYNFTSPGLVDGFTNSSSKKIPILILIIPFYLFFLLIKVDPNYSLVGP